MEIAQSRCGWSVIQFQHNWRAKLTFDGQTHASSDRKALNKPSMTVRACGGNAWQNLQVSQSFGGRAVSGFVKDCQSLSPKRC